MGYDMYSKGARSDGLDDYFRLNIFGMGEAREALHQVGIVRSAGMPPVPKLEDFGLSEYPDEDDTTHPYVRAIMAWKEHPNGEAPGIPSYKLGSNDGWLVLPVEVQSGVRWADEHHPGWRARLNSGDDSYIGEFVTWMEGCTEGFEVW